MYLEGLSYLEYNGLHTPNPTHIKPNIFFRNYVENYSCFDRLTKAQNVETHQFEMILPVKK